MKKLNFNLKPIKSLILFLLVIACSSDDEEINNIPPAVSAQSFNITENVATGTSIGSIIATDEEDDFLTFSFAFNPEFMNAVEIVTTTGEIRVRDIDFFDFESNESFTFDVTVSDGNSNVTADITINIDDIDDGPLRNVEKTFLDEYQFIVSNFSPTSFGSTLNQKWTEDIRMFLDGNNSNQFSSIIDEVITEFNMLFTNDVEITIVNSLEEANIHVVYGPKSLIEDIWPNVFNSVCQGGFTGFANFSEDGGSNILQANIWVNTDADIGLFRHELGHAIGLGHSDNFCDIENERFSTMCPNPPSQELSDFDEGIIRILYHPNVNAGDSFSQSEATITELLLSGFVDLE